MWVGGHQVLGRFAFKGGGHHTGQDGVCALTCFPWAHVTVVAIAVTTTPRHVVGAADVSQQRTSGGAYALQTKKLLYFSDYMMHWTIRRT